MKELKLQKFDKLTDSIPPLSADEFTPLKNSVQMFGIKCLIKEEVLKE